MATRRILRLTPEHQDAVRKELAQWKAWVGFVAMLCLVISMISMGVIQ